MISPIKKMRLVVSIISGSVCSTRDGTIVNVISRENDPGPDAFSALTRQYHLRCERSVDGMKDVLSISSIRIRLDEEKLVFRSVAECRLPLRRFQSIRTPVVYSRCVNCCLGLEGPVHQAHSIS